jgi:cytochrome d ubiquinol oxidase subunit II
MMTLGALPALTSAYLMLALLWLSLIAFAIFGGADFGAGIWDLFAFGSLAEKERGALIQAIGPIWEANEIWLIFLVTGLFTAFPIVFSSLSIAMFFPAVVALIGTVLRGAAFAYYSHFRAAVPVKLAWGRTFSVFSLVAPFSFGVIAGAVASGHIHIHNGAPITDYVSTWLAPFPLLCGAYAVAMCALLAAVYMAVEAHNTGDQELVQGFRTRALIAYAATGVIGAVAGIVCYFDARHIWTNMTGRGLPFVLATAALGIATALLLLAGRYVLARIAVVATVAGIFVAWADAQFPYLVPPDITIQSAASPPSVMGPLLVGSIVGMAILLPSLWLLLYLFKARNRPEPQPSAEAYLETLPPAPGDSAALDAPVASDGHRTVEMARATPAAALARRSHTDHRMRHVAEEAGIALVLTIGGKLMQRWLDLRAVASKQDDDAQPQE